MHTTTATTPTRGARILRRALVCGGTGLVLAVAIPLGAGFIGIDSGSGIADHTGAPPTHGRPPELAEAARVFGEAWPSDWPEKRVSWGVAATGLLRIACVQASDREWPSPEETDVWFDVHDQDPALNPFPRSLEVTAVRVGWPVPVLEGWWMFEHPHGIPVSSGWRSSGGVLSIPGSTVEECRYIPMKPVASGLVLGGAFWGGAVFLLTGVVRSLRRRLARVTSSGGRKGGQRHEVIA